MERKQALPLFLIFCGFLFLREVHANAPPDPITAAYSALRSDVVSRSPELRAAQAAAEQKQAAAYTAWTRWIPHLDFQLRQSRSKDYSLLTSGQLGSIETIFPGGFSPIETSLSAWYLNFSMPIYNRSVHVGILQSRTDSEAADRQYDLKLSELDWRLRQALGNYLLQLYRIETLKSSIELARANLRDANLRFKMGDRTRVDVLRAEANLSSLESRVLTYDQDRTAAFSVLLEYAGLSRERLDELISQIPLGSEKRLERSIESFSESESLLRKLEPLLSHPDRTRLGAQLAAQGPAYRAYLAEEQAALTRARLLMSAEWPELLAQANINKQAPDWQSAFSPGMQSHTISVVLTIPIFSGGSIFSTHSEKSNAEHAAMIQRERSLLQLQDEVENEALQIQSLQKTLDSLSLNLARNSELVRLSRRSYQLGKTSLLELLVAQSDWVDAKVALAQSQLNLSVLVRRFSASLGVTSE